MNIHKISISILSTLMLFLGFSAPTFAVENGVQKCEVSIPSSSKPGDLLIVFAKGPAGSLATDWKDDGGGQGWLQLPFSEMTKGRDVNTAVFYKRNSGQEKDPTFLREGMPGKIETCGMASYTSEYFFKKTKKSESSNFFINIKEHSKGQARNVFEFKNKKKATIFRFAVDSEEAQNIQELSIGVVATNIDTKKVFNFRLYRDVDDDGLYTTDTDILLTESVSDFVSDAQISFTDVQLEKGVGYIVTADTKALKANDFLTLSLSNQGIVRKEVKVDVTNDVSSVTHRRASGGSYTRYRGTNYGGDLIEDDPDYFWPTADAGEWLYAEYAYDKNDGTYAMTSNINESHVFYDFNLTPTGTIDGIEVKMEVSALDSSEGVIEVDLSWDGGVSWTMAKITPILSTTDSVVYVGSGTDLWGRISGRFTEGWKISDYTNGNFRVRVKAKPQNNAVQIDGLQVRVYFSSMS